VQLCEEHSIVSEYASFIVLENDQEYRRWKIKRRNAVRVERDRAAQQQVRRELEQLRDDALAQLGPSPVEPTPVKEAVSNSPMPANGPAPQRSWGRNLDFRPGGGGGGGAIDPLTGLIILGLGGAGAASARRRKKRK
jgi:hypothetical protein